MAKVGETKPRVAAKVVVPKVAAPRVVPRVQVPPLVPQFEHVVPPATGDRILYGAPGTVNPGYPLYSGTSPALTPGAITRPMVTTAAQSLVHALQPVGAALAPVGRAVTTALRAGAEVAGPMALAITGPIPTTVPAGGYPGIRPRTPTTTAGAGMPGYVPATGSTMTPTRGLTTQQLQTWAARDTATAIAGGFFPRTMTAGVAQYMDWDAAGAKTLEDFMTSAGYTFTPTEGAPDLWSRLDVATVPGGGGGYNTIIPGGGGGAGGGGYSRGYVAAAHNLGLTNWRIGY